MTFFQTFLMAFCLLLSFCFSSMDAHAAPLDNFKSSKILKGDCKKQRSFLLETSRIFKDVMYSDFAKSKVAKAEKSLLTCLRDTFKAKLAEKINSLTKKQRTIKNYDGNGKDLVVKKSSLNDLRSLARFWNDDTISSMSEEMKDAALMSLSYFKKEEVITIAMKKVWPRKQ